MTSTVPAESSRAPAPTFIVAALLLTAAGIAVAVFSTDPTSVSPACWLGDALNYCAVTDGQRATEPFNRRPVVPELVRLFPGSVSARYRAVAIFSLIVIAVLGAVLALRLCRHLGLGSGAVQAVVAGLVAAIVVMPDGLRLAWSMPILIDHAGLAAGLLWIVVYTSRDPRVQRLSVPFAILTVATREVWVGVIVAGACLGFALGARRLAALNIAVAVAVYLAVRAIPAAPPEAFVKLTQGGGPSEFQVARYWWDFRWSSLSNMVNTVWSLVFAVGLLPLLLVNGRAARWLRTELEQKDRTAATLVLAGVALIATAPLLGVDVTRLAYPGGVLLMIVAIPWIAARGTWTVVPLAVGTLVIWEPTRKLIANLGDYNAFYVAGKRVGFDLTIAIISTAVAVAVVMGPRLADAREKPGVARRADG